MSEAEPQYRRMLREEFAKRAEKNSRYSVRAFAKSLRLDSGALSQILAGSRIPSERVSKKLIDRLGLSPEDQAKFLSSLAHTHSSRNLQRVSRYFKRLAATPNVEGASANTHYRELSPDLFRTISDWYHYAILELTFVEGFKSDPRWVASELGITLTEAKLGIIRLVELGYLREESGRLVKSVPPLLTTDRHLTSVAHRKRQRQILEKSIVALDEVPIADRNHSAMTMAIDTDRIPEAKAMIQKFFNELSLFLESGPRKNAVYEASIGLFPLQIQKKESV